MNRRITTGIGFGAAFLAALFVPVDGLFMIVVAGLLAAGCRELAILCGLRTAARQLLFVGPMLAIFFLFGFFGLRDDRAIFQLALTAFWLWMLVIPLLVRFEESKALFANPVLIGTVGNLFLLSTALGLLWLKIQPQGEWRVVLLVGLVAVADTCAFYSGRAFGRYKLASEISPAKTFEGVYGGFVGNFVLALIVMLLLHLSTQGSLLLFLLILGGSALSVVGDLFESAVKRQVGVKDSGDWLPGHGGILDRIDGLMAATPYFVLATLLFSPIS